MTTIEKVGAVQRKCLLAGGAFLSTTASSIIGAHAQETSTGFVGAAHPGEMGLLQPATPIADEINFFHNAILLPIITVICLLVLALIAIVVFRFNERSNPVPSRTTHNSLIEVVWTIVPVLVLVVIAIPSFRLLDHQLTIPTPDVTIKVTGQQWYWSYEYPKDQGGGFNFDSVMKADNELKPENGDIRLLTVDNEAVVPVNKNILVQVTSADVIHAFAMRSFGVHVDAVPGRLNTVWFRAEKEGVYYGQCSNICGKDHAFMPIEIRVVSDDAYKAWLADAQKKFAKNDKTRLASAEPAVR